MKEMIHDYCVKNDIDGISVCIHLKGEEVFSYQEGFKNEQKERVDRHTRFTIGSISKLFITVGILQLEEKGLLSLKDPVYSYLPDFKMDDPRYKDITIEMLLNHSSGLPSVSFKKKYTNHFEPSYIQDILKMYQTLPLKSDPGKYSVYCNDGFVLAQYLLETLTKQSFRDYCLEHIALPCKMMDTEFPGAILDEKSYAHAFNEYDHSFNQEFVNGIGSGGVYSTAKDLCLFYDTFYNGKLLSQTSIDKMKELHAKSYLQLESNTNGYGLGFDYVEVPYFKAYGKTALAKGGATFGYMSYGYVILEDQLSVCIVATSKEAGVTLLAKELGAHFLNTEPKTLYLDKVVSQVDAIDGIYGAGNRVYQIQKQENQLKLSVLKGTKFKEVALLQQKADEFVSQDVILGFKQPHFGFVFEQGKCFMYVNYFDGCCEVRSILACRIDFKKDNDFTLNEGWYLKTNEYLDQRTFYTQDLEMIPIIKKQDVLLTPFPLMITDEKTAIPFIELPGSYSREMCELKVIDENHFILGPYRYVNVRELTPLKTMTIENEQTMWFKYQQEKIQTSGKVRLIGIHKEDEQIQVVYDSYYCDKIENYSFEYLGVLGEVGGKLECK